MAVLVNVSQNPPMVIDTSSPYPMVRPPKRLDSFFSNVFNSVFSQTENDLDGIAALCKDALSELQLNAQNLSRVLHIHRCLYQLSREEGALQGKISGVATMVFDGLHNELCKTLKNTRGQVFQLYAASILTDMYKPVDGSQGGKEAYQPLKTLPSPLECLDQENWGLPQDAVFASILSAANELYAVYPDEAKTYVEYVNQTVAEIQYLETKASAMSSEEKKTAMDNLMPPLGLLLSLPMLISEIHFAKDAQWEQKLHAIVVAILRLHNPLRKSVLVQLDFQISAFCQSPNFPGFSDFETVHLLSSMCRKKFFTWPSTHPQEMRDLISRARAEIGTRLEQIITSGDKLKQKAYVSLLGLLYYSTAMPQSISVLIARSIGQGQISLASDEMHFLVNNIVEGYKENLDGLVKILGKHAGEFFKIYVLFKLTQLHRSFMKSPDLDSPLQVLKDYSQVPFRMKMVAEKMQPGELEKWKVHFSEFMKRIFSRPITTAELLKFGQVCYLAKELFSFPMPSQSLSDATFESLLKQLAAPIPSSSNESLSQESLDGKGSEDPVMLLQALPIDEPQKERLVQAYKKSLE
jgi:hypothetical protein